MSAISSAGWDLGRDLALWEAEGVSSVGLSLSKLEAAGLDAAVGQVASRGLRVTNVLGLGFDLGNRARWPGHQDRLVEAVEAAAALGAGCFVLTTGAAGVMPWEAAAGALAEAIAPVSAAADRHQLPMLLEHTHALRADIGFVHTLRDDVDLADRLGLGVLLECNACWAERDVERTIVRAVDRIGLVQVSDYRIGTRCTPDRLVPGDGDIPLRRMMAQLLDAGYHGVFDLEIIGPAVEAEGYPSAIRRSLCWLTAVLSELGA